VKVEENIEYARYVIVGERNYFTFENTRQSLPPEAHPVGIYINGNKYHPQQDYNLHRPQAPNAVSKPSIDEEDPVHVRQSNELVAVSDGSVDPMTDKAAYNWRITNSKGMGKITRSCFLYANPKYADSYFAELSGLNDLVRWIKEAGLHHKSIVIGCDNKACVDLLSSTYISLTDLDREQGDLLRNTKMIFKNSTMYDLNG
jgi:hypothetical protein